MTRTPRLAVATVALALALAGCGSDDDPTLATAGESPAAAAAPSCPTEAEDAQAPASVSKDLEVRPKVPVGTGTPPTAVTVADVVVGDGAQASPGAMVKVKYVGATDKDGKEFDASWNSSPETTIDYQVCGQDVVPGFSVAPLGMKVGGRRVVRIPDAFGYPGGNPGAGIAAGDVITFVIDLVEVG